MAAKKRQHYVPRFLLRRFAAREGRWQGHVFRLDTKTGRPRPAVPRTEAAKNRYYDLPDELVGEFPPESILERIESSAAAAISRLEAGHELQRSDVVWLAYFSSLQTSRTPLDRAERRYLDEVMAQQLEELRFSAREQAIAFLRRADPTLSEAQAEARRREILDDLGAGRLHVESAADVRLPACSSVSTRPSASSSRSATGRSSGSRKGQRLFCRTAAIRATTHSHGFPEAVQASSARTRSKRSSRCRRRRRS